MKKKPISTLAQVTEPIKALSQVLKESEIVLGMVKESGDELASVNLVLNEEFSNRDLQPDRSIREMAPRWRP